MTLSPKFIFIVGGVMSGIGKGVATAAIGRALKSRGFNVTAVKIDPYLNVDAGTMNPTEHGEVFVTSDGLECDQDIGNYERFLGEKMGRENYMTTGLVYKTVIERERNLGYGGKCVETVPHIPQEVIKRLQLAAKKHEASFVLVEIGGTVGEYQNMIYLESARLLKIKTPQDVLVILVSYLPVPKMVGEMKTKPTQYATRTLNSAGLQPDIIIARSALRLDGPRKAKVAMFCNVRKEDIISAPDTKLIYEIPLNFEKEKISERILTKFGLKAKRKNLKEWRRLVVRIRKLKPPVKIAIVGKYFSTGKFILSDSYISVIEALKHAAWANHVKPQLFWLDAETYEHNPRRLEELKKFNAVLIPGGFGKRGVEGKIKVIGFCRKNKIPFLGLCYGMQLAVVEFARNVCNLKSAHTTEVYPQTRYPVVATMADQVKNIEEKNLGGSMRLGNYECKLLGPSLAARAYGVPKVWERHRHRYEINNSLLETLTKNGLVVAGFNPDRNLVEIIELQNHPFFCGTQFHPEFNSQPLKPHPLFFEFIKAAKKRKTNRRQH